MTTTYYLSQFTLESAIIPSIKPEIELANFDCMMPARATWMRVIAVMMLMAIQDCTCIYTRPYLLLLSCLLSQLVNDILIWKIPQWVQGSPKGSQELGCSIEITLGWMVYRSQAMKTGGVGTRVGISSSCGDESRLHGPPRPRRPVRYNETNNSFCLRFISDIPGLGLRLGLGLGLGHS